MRKSRTTRLLAVLPIFLLLLQLAAPALPAGAAVLQGTEGESSYGDQETGLRSHEGENSETGTAAKTEHGEDGTDTLYPTEHGDKESGSQSPTEYEAVDTDLQMQSGEENMGIFQPDEGDLENDMDDSLLLGTVLDGFVYQLGAAVSGTLEGNPQTQVHVIVENTTFPVSSKAPWEGCLVDTWLDVKPGQTMMQAVISALDGNDIPHDGSRTYISSIQGLGEKNEYAGSGSGWMGTLNDWFVNEGFASWELTPGDEIRVMYTRDMGSDLGKGTGTGTKLVNLDVYDAAGQTVVLSGISDEEEISYFYPMVYDYKINLGKEDTIRVVPTAADKDYQARVYVGDVDVSLKGFRSVDALRVYNGDVVTVVCGDPSWPGPSVKEGEEPFAASYYTIRVESEINRNAVPEVAEGIEQVKREAIKQGENFTLDLSGIFIDADADPLTYYVSEDGAEKRRLDSCRYILEKPEPGNYILEFYASDEIDGKNGKEYSLPYTVHLAVNGDTPYTITVGNTTGGTVKVEADGDDGSDGLNFLPGTKVTVIVEPEYDSVISSKYTGKCLKSLKIIDEKSRNIEREQIVPIYAFNKDDTSTYNILKREFTFFMPNSAVTINAEFADAIQIKIANGVQFPQKLFDAENNQIYASTKETTPMKTYYVAEGDYQLVAYDSEYKTILAETSLSVPSEMTTMNAWTVAQVRLVAEEWNIPGYDDTFSYGAYVEVKDEKGNIVSPYLTTLTDKGSEPKGYKEVNYCLIMPVETKNSPPCLYSFRIMPADSRGELSSYQIDGNHGFRNINVSEGTGEIIGNSAAPIHTTSFSYCAAKGELRYTIDKDANPKLYQLEGVAYKESLKSYTPSETKDNGDGTETLTYTDLVPGNTPYLMVAGGKGTEWEKTYHQFDYKQSKGEGSLKLNKPIREWKPYSAGIGMSYVSDNVYTNVPDDGACLTMKTGEDFDLKLFRVWQTVMSDTTNTFVEPDFEVEVLSGDSVKVGEVQGRLVSHVNLHAEHSGPTILKITYGGVRAYNTANGNYRFNPIDPSLVGIVAVNVDGDNTAIDPGLPVENWSKYDTVYITGNVAQDGIAGSEKKADEKFCIYTLAPAAKDGSEITSVRYRAFGKQTDSDWQTGQKDNEKWKIKLRDGRNLVELTAGNAKRYYVINALETDITISNVTSSGQPITAGDKVSVSYSRLQLPVQKMAGIYNPGWTNTVYITGSLDGKTSLEGKHGQYVVGKSFTFVVDEEGKHTVSDGRIHSTHMGSKLDTHCKIEYTGTKPNFNASQDAKRVLFSALPDVTFEVGKAAEKIPQATVAINIPSAAAAPEAEQGEKTENGYKWKLTAAAPNEGYEFLGWTESGKPDQFISTELSCEVTITGDTAYIAQYKEKEKEPEKPAIPTVSAVASPIEGGKADVVKASENKEKGTAVYKLTATANEGYEFVGWLDQGQTESGYVGKEAAYTTPELTKDAAYTAVFKKKAEPSEKIPQATVAINIPSAAAAPKAEQGAKSGNGYEWKLTASKPNAGYKFTGWAKSEDPKTIISDRSTYTVVITKDTGFIAVYAAEQKDQNEEKTLTYKNFPVSVKGKGLENCELVVTQLTADDADVKLMQRQISTSRVLIRLYDIKLYKDGSAVQPESAVTLGFQVGTNYNGKTLQALHVKNGEVETLSGTVENGILSVTVSGFSKFGVVVDASSVTASNNNGTGTGNTNTTGTLSRSSSGTGQNLASGNGNSDDVAGGSASANGNVRTGDETNLAGYLLLMLLAASAAVYVWRKEKKEKAG